MAALLTLQVITIIAVPWLLILQETTIPWLLASPVLQPPLLLASLVYREEPPPSFTVMLVPLSLTSVFLMSSINGASSRVLNGIEFSGGLLASCNTACPFLLALSFLCHLPAQLRHFYFTLSWAIAFSRLLKASFTVNLPQLNESWGFCLDIKSCVLRKCLQVNELLLFQSDVLDSLINHSRNPTPGVPSVLPPAKAC